MPAKLPIQEKAQALKTKFLHHKKRNVKIWGIRSIFILHSNRANNCKAQNDPLTHYPIWLRSTWCFDLKIFKAQSNA